MLLVVRCSRPACWCISALLELFPRSNQFASHPVVGVGQGTGVGPIWDVQIAFEDSANLPFLPDANVGNEQVRFKVEKIERADLTIPIRPRAIAQSPYYLAAGAEP